MKAVRVLGRITSRWRHQLAYGVFLERTNSGFAHTSTSQVFIRLEPKD